MIFVFQSIRELLECSQFISTFILFVYNNIVAYGVHSEGVRTP